MSVATTPDPAASPVGGHDDRGDLRILEIGSACLFKRTWPDRVTWLCPGGRPARAPFPVVVPPFETAEAERRLTRELAEGKFDMVVYLAKGVPGARPSRRRLLAWNVLPARRRDPDREAAWRLTSRVREVPLAVLDIQDATQINPADLPLLDRSEAFFKRELPRDASSLFFRWVDRRRRRAGIPARMHPMPIALGPERVAAVPAETPEKTMDVYFSGNIGNSGARRRGLEELVALRESGVDVVVDRRRSLEEYMARSARARIVWSPEGYGEQCFRHYEAPLCGAVPVISRSSRILHRPLEEGVHCFHYDADVSGDLSRVLREALRDRSRLREMARLGREHVLRHHTFAAVAQYIVETTLGTGHPAGDDG